MTPKIRIIATVVALLLVGGGSYWGIRWYFAPLHVLARQEASILQDINASKRQIEALETQLQTEQAHLTDLQAQRADVEQQKIAEANKGVNDPRPIVPFPASPQ